ncbi:MAG: crossover junction endodeoxyribonuclease RuvC [Bacteroides sp.]|nr:crossover junction endodeoxyribonuclease RuvC [Prevotella sp.]MCM1407845.1 crossover junction endodeoxyribonuclease RuvC [Treponema brennaborense]MCM1469587.1 crossover junction endodeoxyribonuclease RuvC [Bacteroides sp.]
MNTDFLPLPGSAYYEQNAQNTCVRRILGIDPGLASTGYGIIDYAANRCRHIVHGVIETAASLRLSERLLCIRTALKQIIQTYSPQEAAVEALYFAKNVTSAIAVAEAKGVVIVSLAEAGIHAQEYQPNAIKQTVCGTVKSGKQTVQQYVKLLLGLAEIPKPDHAADALAAAITHAHSLNLAQTPPSKPHI